MSKHTLGPWRYRPNKYDDWGLVRAADGFPVATAGMSFRIPAERECVEPEEVTANGRLIAAAPDLLEACKAALPMIALYATEPYENHVCGPDSNCDCHCMNVARDQELIARIKAAIAKAEN